MAKKIQTLCFLVVQIVLMVTVMRYSRVSAEGKPYLSSSVVVLAEFLKVFLSICLVIRDAGSWEKATIEIRQKVVVEYWQTLKMALPATLYAFQNNLLFIALSHLDSAVYQIVYQIKTLTTAMFAVLILNKKITQWQWFALVLLAIGVGIVQLGITKGNDPSKSSSESDENEQNPFIGICAVLMACLSSGFAGIYFEKVLKRSKQSIWIRNIQLGMFGGVASAVTMLIKDWEPLQEVGFFHAYTPVVLLVIVLQASTGLIVAMVVKYTDNIVKAFAGALAIIGSSVVSIIVFDFKADRNFVFGGFLVVCSVYIYGTKGKINKK